MQSFVIRIASAFLLLIAFVPGVPVHGAENWERLGWERLGTRMVQFRGDVDTIAVGRRDGSFRTIMFEVDGGAIEMRNIRVVFFNGDDFSPPTRLVFGDDTRSRTIDLPGGNRFLRSVTFNYRSLLGTGQGRAMVTLYGR